jgi:hypothetical protein
MFNGNLQSILTRTLLLSVICLSAFATQAGTESESALTEANAITPRLEVARFQAWRTWSANQLAWVSTNEVAVDHFIVERSIDGETFSEIATLQSRGAENSAVEYMYKDGESPEVSCFYQIRAIAIDGSEWTIEAKSVANRQSAAPQIFVQDMDHGRVQVMIGSVRQARVTVFDMHGNTILRTNRKAETGQNNIATGFDMSQAVPGPYWVEVQLNDGTVIRNAFIR